MRKRKADDESVAEFTKGWLIYSAVSECNLRDTLVQPVSKVKEVLPQVVIPDFW